MAAHVFCVALASALIFAASALRAEVRGQQDPQTALPSKKAFGPLTRGCSRRVVKARGTDSVIGGTVVDSPDEFPFIAWLGDNDPTLLSFFCGGSLISDRIVLTAGHCLYGKDSADANLLVRLRLTDYGKTNGVARDVVNWRRHSMYSESSLFNDLTLLLLNESVPESLVRPVQVSDGSKSFEHSGMKRLVGWGTTDENCTRHDSLLRTAEVSFGTDGTKCSTPGSKTLAMSLQYDWKSQCCAGDYAGDVHYPGCGDSGGPLLARDGDWWSAVGTVSWSYGAPYPDVFTRVSYFKEWIKWTTRELLAAGEHPAVRKYGPPSRKAAAARSG